MGALVPTLFLFEFIQVRGVSVYQHDVYLKHDTQILSEDLLNGRMISL